MLEVRLLPSTSNEPPYCAATSARDKVVMNPTDLEENPKSARNQWGRPGSTVVKALNQLPISVGTVSLESTGSGRFGVLSGSVGSLPFARGCAGSVLYALYAGS